MRLQDVNKISNLALKGYGYKKIANLIGMSPNTVKSHLQRHPVKEGLNMCIQCGKLIEQAPCHKEKKYCSDKCRMAYWNSHKSEVNKKAYYTITCVHCGKEFVSYGNKHRKYCNRGCFADARRKNEQVPGAS